MKPVYQTKFGDEGNCLQACIASLLELPLDCVPIFVDESGWINQINRFLSEYDLYMEISWEPDLYPPACYYMAWGKSPRGLDHSVIYYNGNLAHDPHPDGGGVEIESIAYMVRRFVKSA